MKKIFLILLAVVATTQQAFPAGEIVTLGSRSSAMGGTSAALTGLWSVAGNPAGTAWTDHFSGGITAASLYLLCCLTSIQAIAVLPVRAGTFGIKAGRLGNTNYYETRAALAYARKFGKRFAASVSLDYLGIALAEGYGTRHLLNGSIGLMLKGNDQLTVGMTARNLVPVNLSENPPERVPATLCAGLSWQFSQPFLATVEVQKDPDNPIRLNAGAEYRLAPSCFARAGISTGPALFSFGIGLFFGSLTIDMASMYHPILGFSPTASLSYSFR